MLNVLNPTIIADIQERLLQTFPQGLCMLDQQYRLTYANERMLDLVGWDKGILGQPFFELLPSADHEFFLFSIEKLLHGELEQIRLEYDAREMLQRTSRWEIDIHKAVDSHLLLIVNDITELSELRGRVAYLNMELEFLQHQSDPLLIFNQNKEIKYTNRAFKAFFDEGDSLETAYIGDIVELYDICDFKGIIIKKGDGPLSRVLQGEEVYNQEVQVINKSNKSSAYFYVCAKPLPIELEQDDMHYILWMKEVSSHVHEERTRKDFIQTAAHELRTPITSIKGFTQLVHERYNERKNNWFFKPTIELIQDLERDHTFFAIILDQVQRLDELTSELLSVYKIDQGKLDLHIEKINFSELVEGTIRECQQIDIWHQFHYINPFPPRILNIDRKQIKRVVHNLLSNAMKYSPTSADIYIEIMEEEQLILSVRDQGLGIPEEAQQRIFERFFRVHHPGHEEIPGNGIGLHICREIIKLHGGDVWFTSKYGEGSSFYLSLPLPQ